MVKKIKIKELNKKQCSHDAWEKWFFIYVPLTHFFYHYFIIIIFFMYVVACVLLKKIYNNNRIIVIKIKIKKLN